MTSPLLALFNRSLREDTRSRFTYISRAGLVLVILLFLWSSHQTMGWSGAPGLTFFSSVLYINVVFVTLVGVSYFASAIAEEKEETTLGLLRMTSLSPLSILLGKSTSRLFGALLLLVAQIPFTLLAITLGGVSLHQIAAAYWTLGAYTFLLCNLALFFSVVCRRTATAAVLTVVVLAVFYFGPPLAGGLAGLSNSVGWISAGTEQWIKAGLAWFSEASPFSRLGEILLTGFSDRSVGYQVISNTAAGVLCFLASWAGFDFFTRDMSESAPRRGVVRRTSRLRMLRASRPWKNALAWKEFHFTFQGRVGLISQIVVYAALIGGISWMIVANTGRDEFLWSRLGYVMIWIGALGGMVGLGHAAARVFAQEVRWKTLSSLATLPMTMRQVAYSKVAGALLSVAPAFSLFCLGWCLLWIERSPNFRPSGMVLFYFIQGALIVLMEAILFPHLVAWLSLKIKHGSLPLGIAIMWVGNMFAGGFSVLVFREAGGVLLIFIGAALIALLHMRIGARLEALAAEES